MPSRLVCWFQGHDWGAWQTGWTNLFGAALDIRYCASAVPWEFSKRPADGVGVLNEPTPEGRALGAELARLADVEEARVRERFPHHHRRCGDCAFRAGTVPNGCPETLMDAVKSLAEGVPFYCHKGMNPDGSPSMLCAGYAILQACTGSTGVPDGDGCTGPSADAVQVVARAKTP